jgi:hypothetical protein
MADCLPSARNCSLVSVIPPQTLLSRRVFDAKLGQHIPTDGWPTQSWLWLEWGMPGAPSSRRGNSPIPTSLWVCDVRVGILTFDRWTYCAPFRSSFTRDGWPTQSWFWLERGCSALPNSVIPTGTDHRKAMICGVEGPCVVTSPGCKERWGSSRNRRRETTKERQQDSVRL